MSNVRKRGITSVMVCSFSSGLDDLKKWQQADPVEVLRVLAATGRYSVFEATANDTIAQTMTNMHHKRCQYLKHGNRIDYGVLLKTKGGAYPWTEIELTEGGKRLLEDNPV